MTSCTWEKWNGTTLDGQNPCCPACDPPIKCFNYPYPPPSINYTSQPKECCPPPQPDWGSYVNPCQPKNFQKVNDDCIYCPGPCGRPCCRHLKKNGALCKYDDPCKAHCFNHPPGMRPSGRYPPNVYRGPLKRNS